MNDVCIICNISFIDSMFVDKYRTTHIFSFLILLIYNMKLNLSRQHTTFIKYLENI